MKRPEYIKKIRESWGVHPIVALLGPRQSGKTTLAREYLASLQSGEVHYFDLEDEEDLAALDRPKLSLGSLGGLIVIDEIQRRPDLFPTLRVLVDKRPRTHEFLILGSASRDLIQQSSESLAGRIEYIEVSPFHLGEVDDGRTLWLRGGYPPSYLAASDDESMRWRKAYIRTYLEQDIPNLGLRIPSRQMLRLWTMLAHFHGNVCNYSELGRSLDLDHKTIKRYIDLLHGTFMVQTLQPWFENLSKRQVKSPKIYIRDSGLLHALLDVSSHANLISHPKVGASWEGYALEQCLRLLDFQSYECFFWATQSHAELDFFTIKSGKRLGFEFKYTDSPRLSKSMIIACTDLRLDHLYVIYPGEKNFLLAERMTALGLKDIPIVFEKKNLGNRI